MRLEELLLLTRNYALTLSAQGAQPIENIQAKTEKEKLNHLRWLCVHILELARTGRLEEATLKLRFLQGALSAADLGMPEKANNEHDGT